MHRRPIDMRTMPIDQAIRQLRNEQGLTQAKVCGIHHQLFMREKGLNPRHDWSEKEAELWLALTDQEEELASLDKALSGLMELGY